MNAWDTLNVRCELGVGTWAWGDKQVWGYGHGYADPDIRGAFDSSIEAGTNFFDTAEMYGSGRSERLLGRFVAETHAQVLVATKFMPLPWRLRGGDLVAALRRSLNRLEAGSVHLYQIHWPIHLRSLHTWMDALADAVDQGLTKGVGVSNYSADQMKRAFERLDRRGIPLVSNQVEYSLLHRAPERNGVLNTCNDLGVKLIAYSPLAMGALTGKYSQAHKMVRYRGIRYNRYLSRIQSLLGLLKEIGQAHGGKTVSQVALNWTLCRGTFPIPGAKNTGQAQENAGAQGWRLTDREIESLERVTPSARR